jgi:hypothetical protein
MHLVKDERQKRLKKARKRNSTEIKSIVEHRRKSDIIEDINLGIGLGGIKTFNSVANFKINEVSDDSSSSSNNA